MSSLFEFATTDEAFADLVADVRPQIDTAARLPDWPFRAASGFATIYEYTRVLGGSFGHVLEALARAYGDQTVTAIVVEPSAANYRGVHGFRPGFRVSTESLHDRYLAAIRYDSARDIVDAVAYSADVVAIAGSSGAWSVWAQRDWEIGLLLTPDAEGPWLGQSVPGFGRDVDLDSIRSPTGWGMSLGKEERETFWRNVRERGSGP